MEELSALAPTQVWSHFAQLCAIPRLSGNEEGAVDYVSRVAIEHGLSVATDAVGNCLITKPAFPGCENTPAIVLQGHLDMVGQKNEGVAHDFSTDPIRPVIDNEWVRAVGTTLGADNGIGAATILAILCDSSLAHGPLQGLFTVEEETGLNGALGIQSGFLSGSILLNLDSSEEGELCIGCAGGCDVTARLDLSRSKVPSGYKVQTITVRGLRGGHSGVDINRGRGNAIRLLVRVVRDLVQDERIMLCSIEGGNARNAIAREARAVLAFPPFLAERVVDRAWIWQTRFERELSMADPEVDVELSEGETCGFAFEPRDTQRALRALAAIIHGPIRMSTDTHSTVETSNNLAVVKTDHEGIMVECLVRSLLDTRKQELVDSLAAVFELAGATYEYTGDYPGWTPNPSSSIIELVQQVYRDLHGISAQANVVHAGLECGILGAANPGMQMVSMGPTIKALHSPDERVHIDSVGRFWSVLVEVLRRLSLQ